MSALQESLIEQLEASIKDGSPEKRVGTLRKITDLFLHDANRLNEEQIAVFDDVLCQITQKIEKTALAELGKRLRRSTTRRSTLSGGSLETRKSRSQHPF